jgi:UDP-N-acetylmuramoyl-L-alanyl-D-glutamate--2,6-diaminopimelate ligase
MFSTLLYHLKRPFHFMKTGVLRGFPAEIQYGFPARKLKIIAITGTDGKTTSSTLLYHVLRKAGKKVALLTTVAAYIGSDEIDTGFHVTTPDPKSLQQFMARMVKEGYEYLVLESTSHGIYQYRLWGIHPEIVGITNITLEHLDYHLNHDLYVQAKLLLARKAKYVVFNADDEMSAAKIRRELKDSHQNKIQYSAQDVLPRSVITAINARFTQAYNKMNSRLVYAIAQLLQVSDQDYAKAIKEFPGVVGRMQKVAEFRGIEVIVDFAHTPNALREALETLRQRMKKEKREGKLIAIFGCAGLRDRKKRPLMGRAGAELADVAIFTAEDPRTEDVWSIIRQMKSDLGTYHAKVLSIANRGEAIEFAIKKLAKPGDIIGIFGKGHEKSMCYGTIEYPWNDAQAVGEITKGPKAS